MSTIPRTSGIYQITCIPTGKIYIGSAINLQYRQRKHWEKLRRGGHENTYLQHAWDKYGESAFTFTVIELILSSFLLEREQYWIDKTRCCTRKRGFNISIKAGAPMFGRKHSPEALEKIRKASSGRIQSEETRQKKSTALKGRMLHPITDVMRAKAVETGRATRGSVHTPETREKLRILAINRTKQAGARSYIVTLPSGDEIEIVNLTEYCSLHGLSHSQMAKVSAGRRKHHRGYTCRRLL